MTAPGGGIGGGASALERLGRAAMRGLGRLGKGGSARSARSAGEQLERLGIASAGIHSTDEELADWEDRLWHAQDDLIEERAKEWRQHLHYCSNEQFIAYHKDRRQWIPRRTVPWRIRANYNVVQKAVNVRVSRLTENKPTVAVQAATGSQSDIDKAEYKQSLFWYLWEELGLHLQVVRVRRWATKCGSGFLKVGWDPDAGCEYPATRKVPRYETVMVPATDAQGQPIPGAPPAPQQILAGVDELYLDEQGNPLGPVETVEQDPETLEQRKVRQPPPPEAATYREGQATVGVRSPFNIRWDQYVDDIADSWYFQDAEILPGSKILAALPGMKAELLEEAKPATDDDKALQYVGLIPRTTAAETGSGNYARAGDPGDTTTAPVDKEYLVRETWIFPKNAFLKKRWGPAGALLITVGGKLVHKTTLPKWAIEATPIVQFIDLYEEGNHYHKAVLRDLVPIQDDINRSRSMMAERSALLSRLLIGAPQNHGLSMKLLAGMPGVLLTYRSPQHKPEPIELGKPDPTTEQFYQSSLAAAQDIGNINDASTGKLPSAGIAAQAIYALQYADERSVTETSTLQDLALKRLARALDWVTRIEYQEARKIRVVGQDRSFLVERELLPEHLDSDVDYFFTPGSMVSRQKEAVKNEMLDLYSQGVIPLETVQKTLSTAVPDAFRSSYELHEAKTRRMLDKILHAPDGALPTLEPSPWDNPAIARQVLEEFMLTAKWDVLPQDRQAALSQLWQAYALMGEQQAAPAAPPAGGADASGGEAPATQPAGGAPTTPGSAPNEPTAGAGALRQRANAAMQQEPPAAALSLPPGS